MRRAVAHNDDFENLLQCAQIATIFLDEELRIRRFTPAATEIFAVTETDIGRPLSDLLPLVESMPAIPNVEDVQPGHPVEDLIRDRSGKSYIRRVLPYQTSAGEVDGMVVTFLDVTELESNRNQRQNSQPRFRRREHQLRTITDAMPGADRVHRFGSTI